MLGPPAPDGGVGWVATRPPERRAPTFKFGAESPNHRELQLCYTTSDRTVRRVSLEQPSPPRPGPEHGVSVFYGKCAKCTCHLTDRQKRPWWASGGRRACGCRGGASLQCGDQVQQSGNTGFISSVPGAPAGVGPSGQRPHPRGRTPRSVVHFLVPSCDDANVRSPHKSHSG